MLINQLNKQIQRKFKKLDKYAKLLSKEKNHTKLLELILHAIKDLTNADGGTLYLPTDKHTLKFEILVNSTLNLRMGGSSNESIPFKDLDLKNFSGKPNFSHIATACFLGGEIINIDDAYSVEHFNFDGAKKFDRETSYRTKSVLAIPLINLEDKVIGIIQLINSKKESGKITSFQTDDIAFAEFLSTHAAITLSNLKLTNDFGQLFESLAKVIATAIDNKSPYTGNHCYRVPEVAMMLTETAINVDQGVFKNFSLTEDELTEMKLAALLHDCGKVSTPVHIIDKATKLETIIDRIDLVETRFEILKRDAEIEFLKKKISNHEKNTKCNIEQNKKIYHKKIARYKNDLNFIKECNVGTEFMEKKKQDRIGKIAEYTWRNVDGNNVNILTNNEIENLSIPKGTLTEKEKELINHHIVITSKMLDQLDFPVHLKNIPEIAGAHHEKLNGKGYPLGLMGDAIPIQARIIGIADIFEALTAKDRPYKKGKTLSETMFILGKMVEFNELDEDLFNLFVDEKLYMKYAEKYLDPYQIDTVDLSKLPGYTAPEDRVLDEGEIDEDYIKAA